jgi:hypothetical protein
MTILAWGARRRISLRYASHRRRARLWLCLAQLHHSAGPAGCRLDDPRLMTESQK